MTTTAATRTLDDARRRLVDQMPDHFERLTWGADRLTSFRTKRLRSLLTVAIEGSRFHARRLGSVDPATFDIGDLASLPTMTKPDMMASYDDIVTDKRLTQQRVQEHLDRLGKDPRLFLDEFVVLTSGGSSGIRGIYTYHHTAATEYTSAVLRTGLSQMASMLGWPPPTPAPLALVAAPVSIHATRALPTFADGSIANITYAPATLPLDQIIDRLQVCQPLILNGYATTIARLADARTNGNLSINPLSVQVTSEQLTPDLTARITKGFGSPPVNSYASSEGLIGTAPPGSDIFDFASDLAIVEYVDTHDQPVPAGTQADHVLVTNLFNHTQPLIRYRIDDAMTQAAASPDHGHQRATLSGRNDEYLTIAGTPVHPLTIRSIILRHPSIHDFRASASGHRLDIDIAATDTVDIPALKTEFDEAVAAAGVLTAEITVRLTADIDRDPRTGKAQRFVTTGPITDQSSSTAPTPSPRTSCS